MAQETQVTVLETLSDVKKILMNGRVCLLVDNEHVFEFNSETGEIGNWVGQLMYNELVINGPEYPAPRRGQDRCKLCWKKLISRHDVNRAITAGYRREESNGVCTNCHAG